MKRKTTWLLIVLAAAVVATYDAAQPVKDYTDNAAVHLAAMGE